METTATNEILRPRPHTVSWKMPALFCNDWAALRISQICSTLVDGPIFDRVYGAPKCAWSGGRPSAVSLELGEEDVRRYLEAYKKVGTTCAFTFSRIHVEKGMHGDPYCNMLLDLIDEFDGEAILFNDDLARYVRETHPNVRRIASPNKAMIDFKRGFAGHADEEAYYRAQLELYDEVVIRCEYAMDDDALARIADLSDRCEIIVNQFCTRNCMHACEHISAVEEWNHGDQQGQPHPCFYLNQLARLDYRLSHNLYMSNSHIDHLVEHGFRKLKIAGRNSPMPKFIEMASQYVFEPTGAIHFIGNEVMREYRLLTQQAGPLVHQASIPNEELIRAALGLGF